MSGIVKEYILQDAVYEPDSVMWGAVIKLFQFPLPFRNLPLVYTFLLHGSAAGAVFKHFTIEALMIGHRKSDGTWWNLYKAEQMPGAITLSQRVFYHEQLPTRENTELRSLQMPNCLFIEEIRTGYSPTSYISIVGIKTIPPDKRLAEVKQILPGLGLFHPDTQAILEDALRGRPPDSGSVTEANKNQALEFVLTKGRGIYSASGEVTKHQVARACNGNFGISARDDRCIDKCAGCQAIDRLIKQCNPQWTWKNYALPRIKTP